MTLPHDPQFGGEFAVASIDATDSATQAAEVVTENSEGVLDAIGSVLEVLFSWW